MTGSRKALPPFRAVVCALLAAAVCALLLLQLTQERRSAELTIGIVLEEIDERVVVSDIVPSGPASLSGLRPDDEIVTINGQRVRSIADYDAVARQFRADHFELFEVEREGRTLGTVVAPGVPFDWLTWSFYALAALVHLGLGLVVLAQGGSDVRARLLWILFIAIGIELALPSDLVGSPVLGLVVDCGFWLLTGLQFAVELHLASVIPQPQLWFRRRRWPLALYYGVGLGFGLLMFSIYLPGVAESALGSWVLTPSGQRLTTAWFLAWPVGVVLLLANSALRWPEPTGRHQAWLVLMGVVPWACFTLLATHWDRSGLAYPHWFEIAQPLVFLIYPLVVFVAIFRYRLFDLEVVVKRSLVYGVLSTILLLVFYGAIGVGGAAMSALLEGKVPTTWVVAGATLLLGLLFSPLKRFIGQQVESRLFPERVALRERLRAMVRDLPLHGKLKAIAESLVDDTVRIFCVESGCLLLADRDSDLLVCRASYGLGDRCSGLLLPKSDSFARHLVQRGRSSQLERWSSISPMAEQLRGLGGVLAVPILRGDDLTGVLLLGAKLDGDDFGAEETELLDLLSHHVATLLENAHLFESATFDGLTGLLRREATLAELGREVDRALRYRRPLAVAMIDVDRFKAVNDRFGHLAGDLMLRRVAAVVSGSVRSTDVVGRYGGEEFLMVLPESDAGSASAVLEKLRRAVEGLEVSLDGGPPLRVTVSVGLACLEDLPPMPPPIAEDLVAAADRSLYRAKHDGRNRIAQGMAG